MLHTMHRTESRSKTRIVKGGLPTREESPESSSRPVLVKHQAKGKEDRVTDVKMVRKKTVGEGGMGRGRWFGGINK